eukprot:7232879-Prymnesium_polylepis.1
MGGLIQQPHGSRRAHSAAWVVTWRVQDTGTRAARGGSTHRWDPVHGRARRGRARRTARAAAHRAASRASLRGTAASNAGHGSPSSPPSDRASARSSSAACASQPHRAASSAAAASSSSSPAAATAAAAASQVEVGAPSASAVPTSCATPVPPALSSTVVRLDSRPSHGLGATAP